MRRAHYTRVKLRVAEMFFACDGAMTDVTEVTDEPRSDECCYKGDFVAFLPMWA